MKTSKNNLLNLLAIAVLCASCQKNTSEHGGDKSPGTIEVNLTGVSFESESPLGNRAATPFLSEELADPLQIQRNTIELEDGLLLVAELSPDEASVPTSLRDGQKAAIITTNLTPNMRYGVQVFDDAGTWVAERTYVRGQEASTTALLLDGGSTYTFVVYSINSATATLPTVSPATATRTLSNATMDLTGTQDYMYFQQSLTVTGGTTNHLDIVLKHRFSQITTIINSVQTGYNVTAVTSDFTPNITTAVANLSDGSFVRGTATGNSPVTFTTPNSTAATSNPTIINAAPGTNISYVIPSLTVGPLTQTNLTPFTTLTVTPGVRYNLTLSIVPTDELIEHAGRPAARINGVIWARHNVGVDPLVDPDPATLNSTIHGNYYQWGRSTRSASGTTSTVNPFINNNEPANNTWNPGTWTEPIKATLDPCPEGYRIPTHHEVIALAANTVSSNRGPFITGASRYDSAKLLTSRRNSSVMLTLPAQGYGSASGGDTPPWASSGVINRGSGGNYWTSYSTNTNRTSIMFAPSSSFGHSYNDNHRVHKTLSRNIRCVGYIE